MYTGRLPTPPTKFKEIHLSVHCMPLTKGLTFSKVKCELADFCPIVIQFLHDGTNNTKIIVDCPFEH